MDGTVGTFRGLARLTAKRRWHRLRYLIPEMLVIAACVAATWGTVTFSLWQARDAAVRSAERQTANMARTFAESSGRIVANMDRELLALQAAFAGQGDSFNLQRWLRTQPATDRLVNEISIVNPAGLLIQSSVPVERVQASVADLPAFRLHLDPARDALVIGQPVTGGATQRCAVYYTRKLVDGDGNFAGVGMNSVTCDDLSQLNETVNADDGTVMLTGLDGFVRAYGPLQAQLPNADFSQSPALQTAFAKPEGSMAISSPWDGVWRIVSFRHLARYPLMVMVGYDDARVFAKYRPMRLRALEIGGAATFLILCLGGVWIQQRLRSSAARRALLLTLENMSQGLVMIDAEGRVPVVNHRAAEMLDLPSGLLDPRRLPQPGEAGGLGLLCRGEDHETGGIHFESLHKGGRIIEIASQLLHDGGQVRTFTDVTEQRIADARVRHMAHHDQLTGLGNRALLMEQLETMTQSPNPSEFGLVCLDLDGFQMVNDSMGRESGDRLLRDVARRLQRVVDGSAVLARIEGDEFAILCREGPQPASTDRLVDAVVAMMAEPFEIDGSQFRLSASLGLAFHPADGTMAPDLLRHADVAMHHAKNRGRGFVVRFDPEMDRIQIERSLIVRDFRCALSNDEFEVWFQPRFETKRLRITGYEALARWRHPQRGMISPAQFVPIAEQSGMITEMGLRVLRDACAFAATLPTGRIAVNLSPVQFLSNNLADVICDVMAEYHLTSDRLELEITEGVLIADEAQALTTLNNLRDRGLHLALDDFGTGYASLSYLRRFPFDRIKLDQSFVSAQDRDETTRVIVENVLALARRLRLEVTAEGVETDHQLNLLREQACPEVQGYLLGRPMPAIQARAFHIDHNSELTGAVHAGRRTAA